MLKSFLMSRPSVVFDATNRAHREAYANFVQKGNWSDCPFQFVLEEPFMDLLSNINFKMVRYYMQSEFA